MFDSLRDTTQNWCNVTPLPLEREAMTIQLGPHNKLSLRNTHDSRENTSSPLNPHDHHRLIWEDLPPISSWLGMGGGPALEPDRPGENSQRPQASISGSPSLIINVPVTQGPA